MDRKIEWSYGRIPWELYTGRISGISVDLGVLAVCVHRRRCCALNYSEFYYLNFISNAYSWLLSLPWQMTVHHVYVKREGESKAEGDDGGTMIVTRASLCSHCSSRNELDD